MKTMSNNKIKNAIKIAQNFSKSKSRLLNLLSIPFVALLASRYHHFVVLSSCEKPLPKQKPKTNKIIKNNLVSKFSNFKFKYTVFRILCGSDISEKKFRTVLEPAFAKSKYLFLNHLMGSGALHFANLTTLNLIEYHLNEFNEKKQYQIYHLAALTSFLLGQNQQAVQFWKKCGNVSKTWKLPTTPLGYRILGDAWLSAVGHVAMIDYYFKFQKLYGLPNTRFVIQNQLLADTPQNNFQKIQLRKFSELGLVTFTEDLIEKDYDKWAKKNGTIFWSDLDSYEKESLKDHFWLHQFPDGTSLSYTHAAARVQKEWEKAEYDPLLKVSDKEEEWLKTFKEKIRLPHDAWYVCLHVRENGFHKAWNSKYPSMRDANIETYYDAIKKITDAGGWVIRMGDSSMTPLPKMTQVIDYAKSSFKHPQADYLLAVTCKFFLGTNSGFATLPVNFGVPCALTNWVPIGWPLWPSQDLMVFKLFKNKKTNCYLSLKEIYEKGLAFTQNISDLSDEYEIEDNSSEDILALVEDMLKAHVFKTCESKDISLPEAQMKAYEDLALQYETYTGSSISRNFAEKYPEVFSCLNEGTEVTEKVEEFVSLLN